MTGFSESHNVPLRRRKSAPIKARQPKPKNSCGPRRNGLDVAQKCRTRIGRDRFPHERSSSRIRFWLCRHCPGDQNDSWAASGRKKPTSKFGFELCEKMPEWAWVTPWQREPLQTGPRFAVIRLTLRSRGRVSPDASAYASRNPSESLSVFRSRRRVEVTIN